MRLSRALPLLACLVLLAAAATRSGLLGPGSGGAGGVSPRGEAQARVMRVVDGDTVSVRLGGRREKVRYIGMDTPEDVKPGAGVRCWSRHAAADNARLVGHQPVTLRFDANPRDRYGRLLAYVYRRSDGLFVNAELVRRGDARARPFPDNTAHRALFARLADAARSHGAGLWARCGEAAAEAFPDP
jgi:micrococcal nuclease